MDPHDPFANAGTPNPVTPPVGAPVAAGPVDGLTFESATSSTAVEKKPSYIVRGAMAFAALLVAGAGAFAITRSLSDPVGPASPEAAVDQMLASLAAEDVIGMTESLTPGERETMVEPWLALVGELQRLEIVDPAMDMNALGGVDIEMVGAPDIRSIELAPGVARVSIVGGQMTMSGDSSALPIGAFITSDLEVNVPDERFSEQVADFASDPVDFMVLAEDDGSWYVSLTYTLAEAARAETNAPMPTYGAGPVPVGAETPEAAVSAIIEHAVALDLRSVLTQLDPVEFAALYDYSPLFLADGQRAVDELLESAQDAGVSWQIDQISTKSREENGRTSVAIDGFSASAEMDESRLSIEVSGECVTVVIDQEIDEWCQDDAAEALNGVDPFSAFRETQTSGVVVVEREGRWYVSGMPTVLYPFVDLLASLERSDLQDMVSQMEEAVGSALGAAGSFDPFAFGMGTPEEDFFIVDDALGGDVDSSGDDGGGFSPSGPADDQLFPAADTIELNLFSSPLEFWSDEVPGMLPVTATTGQDGQGNWIDVLRYEAGTHNDLVAGIEADDWSEPADYPGAPEGSVVFTNGFEWIIVYENIVVMGWDDDGTKVILDAELAHLATLTPEQLAGG